MDRRLRLRSGGLPVLALAAVFALAARPVSSQDVPPVPPPPTTPPAPVPQPVPAPEPPAPTPAAPALEEPQVATVNGEGVNLRVGPRVDNEPVAQLARGTVLLVVERLPGWVGVRVPEGFPVAVAAEFVKAEGSDEVRVTAKRLNARVHPPEDGQPQPGAFRDPLRADQVLARISTDRAWVWVMAPEEVRAYVNAEYVDVLGPLSAPMDQNADQFRGLRANDEAHGLHSSDQVAISIWWSENTCGNTGGNTDGP